MKHFNTTNVIFNRSKKTVGGDLEYLFRNTSQDTLNKIIHKYREDFLLCGYDETLNTLNQLSEDKSEEENKAEKFSY